MRKSLKLLKTGHMDYYETPTQKICALCLPKKMEQSEKCSAHSWKAKSQKKKDLKQQRKNLARLLDPQFESLTQKNKNGVLLDGTQ